VSTVDCTFRRLTRDDFPLLCEWLAEPHVHRWWAHDFTPEAVEEDFGDTVDGEEPAQDYIVELYRQPVGLIQFCMFADYPEYIDEMPIQVADGCGTIDYFVGNPERIGQGVGTTMIVAFVEHLWRSEPTLTHLVVPVNSANVASWRALLRAGFRLVAREEMEPDNPIDERMHEILRIDRPG
jgi:aminoglycoside 6'-N-acetyltransferase